MNNKRGQEMSIGTLLLIVLGVVAVVVIILGFVYGTDVFFQIFKKAPKTLEIAAQACIVDAQAGLYIDYCKEFKEVEISGKKNFVNCQYSDIKSVVSAETTPLDCTRFGNEFADASSSAEWYCGQLRTREGEGFDEDTMVNGESCKSLGG